MMTYEEVEIQLYIMLTSTLGRGDQSGLWPEHFSHGETVPTAYLIG